MIEKIKGCDTGKLANNAIKNQRNFLKKFDGKIDEGDKKILKQQLEYHTKIEEYYNKYLKYINLKEMDVDNKLYKIYCDYQESILTQGVVDSFKKMIENKIK